METQEVLDIGTEALKVLLLVSVPLMLVALVVGLLISLFQALTQIQEMTLTFVPKMIAMFLALVLLLPFILSTLTVFTQELYARIAGSG